MNYEPILNKIKYWKNYKGTGETYRKTHDMDCILTGGNLFADTIFSLWLPLRYTLNYFDSAKWIEWKNHETDVLKKSGVTLKYCDDFLNDFENNIELFLPEHELTTNLIKLFELGQKRCNIMILPYRKWNTQRGSLPYYDYLPHFLYDILNTNDSKENEIICNWIKREQLTLFFNNEIIDKKQIKDLAGTGHVTKHAPKNIVILLLIQNYIEILQQREARMQTTINN